ncbi:PTS sugar transporter subunit IIB [Ligilactobacillus ceti]|uniref:PTS EIIB type-3 domain-containing protein n=1 Tax=Ligilactobacillus ceti DSM 22408 TaxID=1122146 RepID=A0A0R2KIW0_9LACO|nr:PTS sugar transporter subunit IIB [Ligilactobacillus ceti]KRN89327.1 hypothetical protein IV53_GL000044 [Ligilactobacillus ceti DSM 22408]
MAKYTIMLNCAAGMSTSLLVTKMQASAQAQGIDVDIFATGASEVSQQLAQQTIDCVLLGPQVRYMEADFKQLLANEKNSLGNPIPLAVIDMQAYGMMNGEAVLKQALSLIEA